MSLRLVSRVMLLFLVVQAAPLMAQPTNLEVYQDLAERCLAEAPGTATTIVLEAPTLMPYLRTALVQTWQDAGQTIYRTDAADANNANSAHPTLRYTIDEATLAYERAGRKAFRRSVALGLSYTLTASNGQVLADDRCRETYTDTVPRDIREALEQAAYPETQAAPPPPGWVGRYLEPVVLGAATAITIVLFFTLRSDRANDSG